MRTAVLEDVPLVMKPLLAMLEYSPAPQMQFAEPEVAERNVRGAINEGRCFIMGGYFIMVDVGSDWYTSKKYLIEQIILKVNPADKSVTVDDVIAGLDTLRDRFSCDATAVGDTQVGYLTPKYIAAGYKPLGTQLLKERPNGIRP